MLLLKKSKLDTSLYNIAFFDSPGESKSSSMYQNILEGATVLYDFETAFSRIQVAYSNFGYAIEDHDLFVSTVKPFYQALRHGLAFDWVINYFIGEIVRYFPFCHFEKFNGTDPFMSTHMNDLVFKAEIGKLEFEFTRLLDKIYLNGNTTVLRRLVVNSGKNDFLGCIEWAKENGKLADYEISEESLYRTNFLVALGMMLEDGVGWIKRGAWHTLLNSMSNEGKDDDLLVVCGGKYRALAYGNVDGTGIKWHILENGIRVLGLSSDALPKMATYFRITSNSLELDLSITPLVQIGENPAVSAEAFSHAKLDRDSAKVLKVHYPFNDAEGQVLELHAKRGCMIKDQAVKLNSEGIGETQIFFTSDDVQFTVSHALSVLPSVDFSNSKLTETSVQWL